MVFLNISSIRDPSSSNVILDMYIDVKRSQHSRRYHCNNVFFILIQISQATHQLGHCLIADCLPQAQVNLILREYL